MPEGFVVAPIPPEEVVLAVAKENTQANALVCRKVMYKREGAGWCVGEIRSRKTGSRRKVKPMTGNSLSSMKLTKKQQSTLSPSTTTTREGMRMLLTTTGLHLRR